MVSSSSNRSQKADYEKVIFKMQQRPKRKAVGDLKNEVTAAVANSASGSDKLQRITEDPVMACNPKLLRDGGVRDQLQNQICHPVRQYLWRI